MLSAELSIRDIAFVACYSSVHKAHGSVNIASTVFSVTNRQQLCGRDRECVHGTKWASAKRYESMHKTCTDKTYNECTLRKHMAIVFSMRRLPTIWCYWLAYFRSFAVRTDQTVTVFLLSLLYIVASTTVWNTFSSQTLWFQPK